MRDVGVLPIGVLLLVVMSMTCLPVRGADTGASRVPPAWRVLPIPRYADYGSSDDFITLGKVAIVRREGSPYQSVRDDRSELVGQSTITEEELTGILTESGVTSLGSFGDDLASYEGYDTLILLGSPEHNAQTAKLVGELGLSFGNWDDANTPDDDFTAWPDLGKEGYILKVGRSGAKNIAILAGYDFDDVGKRFHGAGTFYAMQSFRQLIESEAGRVKAKTVEIADAPLVAVRGAFSGFDPYEDLQWRCVEFLPRMKANQNIYWYGNAIGGYNAEAASKFRYPWRPEQLELFAKFGKYSRERYVTMVFCMNPDHYHVDWAAAKTFDGSRKDPLHYDPDHPVEPEFKELWAKAGYEVHNDIDILAAKFDQLNTAVPGAMLQMMNEDDGFGLFNEADQKLYNTVTGDPKQDAVNYGRARAEFLADLYKRIRERSPTSAEFIPLCPPGQLAYQYPLETNAYNCRDFLDSMTATLREKGLHEQMPLITTGGGTATEVVTSKTIDDYKGWANGGPVVITDNNFPYGFHIGAYETDPEGPRSPHQINQEFPAGFRDRELHKRVWGIQWNGFNDQHVLAWCQAQYMWNMPALNRVELNALAARKVSTEASYPIVKAFFEEYDNPGCYLPDCQPPYRVKVVCDTFVFPAKSDNGWQYDITYTGPRRREAQRLRDKLAGLIPQLETNWKSTFEKKACLEQLAFNSYIFSTLYLAYGYIRGWQDDTAEGRLAGADLRDLYLEADDLQERFFAGPDASPGRLNMYRDQDFYTNMARFIYNDGLLLPRPASPTDAAVYVDTWKEALEGEFFEPVLSLEPGQMPDDDPRLSGGWGSVEEADGLKFRLVNKQASLGTGSPQSGVCLVRVKLGTAAPARTVHAASITLSVGDIEHETAGCKPRWVNWLLPAGTSLSELTLTALEPVRVYSVGLYREKD